jgi:hypothetical protein
MPDKTSDAAREGNEAHALAAACLKDAAGGIAPTLDESEMHQAVRMYVDDVHRIMKATRVFGGPYLGIEEKIDCERISPLCHGTTDCFVFDPNSGTLYVWDFKYGHGIVEVFENWQLIAYTAGILDLLGVVDDRSVRVIMRIVQPRAYSSEGPIREWVVPQASDLRGYINRLHTAAEQALSPDAKCITGDQCRYCSARGGCDAALRAGMRLLEEITDPKYNELNPESLGAYLDLLKRAKEHVKYLTTAIEEIAVSTIRSGSPVPGWSMENIMGSLEWTQDAESVIGVAELLGFDVKKPGVLTPTQAAAIGFPIDGFAKRETAIKLKQTNNQQARKIFS